MLGLTSLLSLTLISQASAASANAGDRAGNASWKAGLAGTVITPKEPIWMSGYAARTRPASGKLHELMARALVLEDESGSAGLIVTLDLCGLDRETAARMTAGISARTGLKPERIILSVTHTHSGPVVGSNLMAMYRTVLDAAQVERIRLYTDGLVVAVAELAERAWTDRRPARVEWGSGLATFATNRRANPERHGAELRRLGQLKGPVDHDVPVLAIRAPDGALRGVMVGYACHATTLDGYEWSGDWPGFACDALEAERKCVALAWTGCGADQNPIPRREVALAREYGRQLAAGVSTVLDAPMAPIRGPLAAARSEVPLRFARAPAEADLRRESISSNRYLAATATMWLERLKRGEPVPEAYPYPIAVWRLGDGPTLISMGGEVVVDYALALKRGPDRTRTWVMGYAHDVMAYIPSERVLQEGGYEGGGAMVYYGLLSPWKTGVEAAVLGEVRRLADAARK